MPRLEAMVRAHAQEILCLKAHPLKGSFVTGGNDKRVRVWSLQSYELLATLEGHTEVRAGLYPTPNLTSNPHQVRSLSSWPSPATPTTTCRCSSYPYAACLRRQRARARASRSSAARWANPNPKLALTLTLTLTLT